MRHVQAISLFLKLVVCEQAMAVALMTCRGVVECVALLVVTRWKECTDCLL